jgi:iron(III) transport system ATP-binding protein
MNEAKSPEPQVVIAGLTKRFKRRSGAGDVVPIDNVSLTICQGEFVVLLGPSGCGKTTLLRSIAGLERPEAGSIRIGGTTVFDSARKLFLPPNRRPISMIFQSYALWPHMTVFQNIAYPINSRKRVSKADTAQLVHTTLAQVGLQDLQNQYPGQLSGGQQQRVALARALVTDAKVLLFDEPLSNVDAKVRIELRAQLVEMQRELGFTSVYVTHDQEEAMELADRIAVLNNGRVEQLAAPREVYSRPATKYIAEFIGSANVYSGEVVSAADGTVEVDTALGRVVARGAGAEIEVGSKADVMFRPEDVCLVAAGSVNAWDAKVNRTSFSGSQQMVHLDINGATVLAVTGKNAELVDAGTTVAQVSPDDVRVFVRPDE